MPPRSHNTPGFLSTRGAKLLIGLPLLLAAFALALQVSQSVQIHHMLYNLTDPDLNTFTSLKCRVKPLSASPK